MSTVVKLISLADQIIKEWDKEAFLLSETEYIDLLSEIHKRICLDGKWFGENIWDNEDIWNNIRRTDHCRKLIYLG